MQFRMKNRSFRSNGWLSVIVVCSLLLVSIFSCIPIPVQSLQFPLRAKIVNANASFLGKAAGDQLALVATTAGDVNGDGYNDILIGTYYNDDGGSDAGKFWVFFGKSTGWVMDTSLANSNASYEGEAAGDNSGYAQPAGDVNGDGYDDILVTAQRNDDGGSNAGQAYLIFGKSSGWANNVDLSNSDASFWGENAGDMLGSRLAGVGDVNGDGFDDVMFTAFYTDTNGTNTGTAYLIFGKSNGWAMDKSASNADATFIGEANGDGQDMSVAGPGDVNGDGFDDILVSVCYNDQGGSESGQTYLFFGKKDGWAKKTNVSSAVASFIGEAASDYSTVTTRYPSDLNNDGYDDILIAGPYNDEAGSNAGQVYIFFGKASGWAMDTGLSNADASFWGEASSNWAGNQVAGLGDVNGDGYDDIAIAAYTNDYAGTDRGQVYLILGKSSGWGHDVSLSNAAASWTGEADNDALGDGLGFAGDINGDGYNDLMTGTGGNDENGNLAGQAYLVFPDKNSRPDPVSAVKAYSQSYSSTISMIDINGTIYIQLNGTDNNSTRKDTAIVRVTSNQSAKIGFLLSLIETGVNTGKYRGNVTVKDRTNDRYRWIKGTLGEDVNITSVTDATKKATVHIGNFELKPASDNTSGTEDQPYSANYWVVNGTANSWSFKTNASWLTWSSVTRKMTGTPDNSDVGKFYVNITANTDYYPLTHNFTLTVANVPPVIQTVDVTASNEDVLYSNDYSSDDDGQGTITWHLATNASWLGIDKDTGKLTGTPTNSEVGKFWVNVSIADGNGGKDWSNFTLNIKNIPPIILTADMADIDENHIYSNDYSSDEDGHGTITWHLDTNATWLQIDKDTGVLSGAPNNWFVGQYWVNVSVDDGNGGWDFSNFTLTVINVNDPPYITTHDAVSATEDHLYSNDYDATDIDPVTTTFVWALETNASWLSLNASSGLLSGTPKNKDVGAYHVNVSVSDGMGDLVTHYFSLVVENVPPVILNADVYEAAQDEPYLVDYSSDDDGSGNITWKLVTDAGWLDIDPLTGILSGTPGNDDVGDYWVNVTVDDGNGGSNFTYFKLTVININDPPKILGTDITEVYEDTEYRSNYTVNDIDKTDTVFTWSLKTNASWLTIDRSGGLITGFPENFAVGYYWVNVTVKDPAQAQDHRNFTLTVINVNDPPKWLDVPKNTTITDSENYTFDVNATDIDIRDTLSYGLEEFPTGMTIDKVFGLIQWRPTSAQIGKHEMILNVTDGHVVLDRQFTITVIRHQTQPPWINSTPPLTAKVGQGYEYQVRAKDNDSTNLIYKLDIYPQGMKINISNGLISWTPTAPQVGNNKVVVNVSDGENHILQTYNIQVSGKTNNKPKITSNPTKLKIKVDERFVYEVKASDADFGDNLTFKLTGKPDSMTIDPKTGILSWTPKKADIGSHTVIIRVEDTNGGYDEQTFELEVTRNTVGITVLSSNWLFILLLIIAIGIVITVLVIMKRRKQTTPDEEEVVELEETTKYEELEQDAASKAVVPAARPKTARLASKTQEAMLIHDIFLIYKDGRLIEYIGKGEKDADKDDVIGGMLTAVQSFVKDTLVKDEESELGAMEYGDKKIIFERSSSLILAMVIEGKETEDVRDEMRRTVEKIEGKYAGVVEDWDGNKATFKGISKDLGQLMALEVLPNIDGESPEKGIRVMSALEFYQGYVRLKIAIKNKLSTTITDATFDLLYENKSLKLSRIEPDFSHSGSKVEMGNVGPGQKKTVAYYLDPLICQESVVDGTLTFRDYQGKLNHIDMKRRPVDIVCPIFYTEETVNVAMLKRLLDKLAYRDCRMYRFESKENLKDIFKIGKAVVQGYDVKFVREFVEEDPFQMEAWFYGKTKETNEEMVIKVAVTEAERILEISVNSSNLATLTGLLAELRNKVKSELGKSRRIGKIGIVSEKNREDIICRTTSLLSKFAETELKADETEREI